MKVKWKLNLKALNWKTIIIAAIIIMLVIAAFYAVKFFMKNDDSVPFEVLSEEKMIPQKIQEILPRYKNLERALACKVDDGIYIIATRGEKPTGGYTIEIDRIEKVKEDEDKIKIVVYTTFEDPKPGDIVTQAITYPYVVVKTDLKQLPDKIELKVKYND